MAEQAVQISADAFLDSQTQKTYFEVKVALLGTCEVIPGMPVEAFLSTESRTPVSYAMLPFMFYF